MENIIVRAVEDKHLICVRHPEVERNAYIRLRGGRVERLGPGWHLRGPFSVVKAVDMGDVCKALTTSVVSKDHFEFDVEANVRLTPNDPAYIVKNEDRINQLLERTIKKHLDGISATLTETEGWEGNVYTQFEGLEDKMRIDLVQDGVAYRDAAMKMHCPEQFLVVAAHRYGLKHYLEFDAQLRGHLFHWLEKESDLKAKEIERIINAIGKYPHISTLIFGTFREILGEAKGIPRGIESSDYNLLRPYIRTFLQTETAKKITGAYQRGEIVPQAMSDTIDLTESLRATFFPRRVGRRRYV